MRGLGDDDSAPRRLSACTLVAVGCVSAALIAYEIVLMRRLLIERWHHFGYLVISAALLGFGASGSFLAVLERRVRARPAGTMFGLAVALVLTLVAMPRVALLLPVTARFIPDDLWSQVGWWSLYWLAALAPFLFGAALLGAALMTAGSRVGRVYAANLFGSGAGAVGAVLIVSRFPIEYGLWPSVALAVLGVLLLPVREHTDSARTDVGIRVLSALSLAALAGGAIVYWPLLPSYDEHKYAGRLEQLAKQGAVRRVAARADPHGTAELYESELFHDLPFAALVEAPPPMYSLVINGDPAGSVLRVESAEQAGVMDGTLMAFPYALIRARPGVLLAGETGGANAWLARRHEATRIDLVQPNEAVISLWREFAAPLVRDARLKIHARDSRGFLASERAERYDLVQIVSLEGLGAGSAGMRGLAEDHLATVEGFADCLRALTPDGVLAVSRGIQEPERENIRIFATLVEALEIIGVDDAARHMIQVRDYLGVCTLATRTALSDARRDRLRAAIRAFSLTPVWYDGLPVDDVNQPDSLRGPPGSRVDWLHYAASEILSPNRQQFFDSWLLNVRPPHDDSPFFWDFYKSGAVAELKEAYGDLWLTRAELGRLFLYVSLLIGAAGAVGLILVPLGAVELSHRAGNRKPGGRGARVGGGALRMVVYFGGIGLGFMGVEMALISRAIRWLGDPVIASAAVIGGILVISGVGSLTGQRLVGGRTWRAPALVALAAVLIRFVSWPSPGAEHDAGWPLVLAALPAAYLMGVPMPVGIAALNQHRPHLVPWAWGVNGVASVMATSAAIVIAMTTGYRTVMLLAVAAYAGAAIAAWGRRMRIA